MRRKPIFGVGSFLLTCAAQVDAASHLDTIGVTLLRKFDPTLQGSGVRVALVEPPINTNTPPPFQVRPSSVGQPISLFTFVSEYGDSSIFPNAVGTESGHADSVAANFFGVAQGVAPDVDHVYNYEADYFYDSFVSPTQPVSIPANVVNQSFVFDQSAEIEQKYDNHAAQFGTIFVSGAAQNFQQVRPAATAFNGIGVGVSDDGNPPFGPTPDGRCKPDIVAPGSVASFSTPLVAGSAAILLQAAARADAGLSTSVATNLILIKALLLNGALKPIGWTNNPISPLDLRRGAGVVNVFNSWHQLRGGRHLPIESTSASEGEPHPPGSSQSNISSLVGWDYNSLTNSSSNDKINHYYFNLPGTNNYTLTATLVWNRQQNKVSINDLNFFFYRMTDGVEIRSSISTVDNVEHLSIPQLPPGRYDLQVVKKGSRQVSADETYAIAFEMFNLDLQFESIIDKNVVLSWPVFPSGFRLEECSTLIPPAVWTAVTSSVNVNTNIGRNVAVVSAKEGNRYFRLARP